MVEVGKIAYAIGAGDGAESVVGKRHLQGAGFEQGDGLRHAGLRYFLCADVHHASGNVDAGNAAGFVLADYLDGKVGGAHGNIEQMVGRAQLAHGATAPPLVDIEREEVVEPIVGRGDRIKK